MKSNKTEHRRSVIEVISGNLLSRPWDVRLCSLRGTHPPNQWAQAGINRGIGMGGGGRLLLEGNLYWATVCSSRCSKNRIEIESMSMSISSAFPVCIAVPYILRGRP